MTVLVADIVIEANAAFDMPLTWLDRYKEPMPLSSYEAKMQVRLEPDSPSALISVSSPSGGITLAAEGDIDVFIGASLTVAVLPHVGKTGVYDLVLVHKTDADRVIKLMKGKVTFGPGVTR